MNILLPDGLLRLATRPSSGAKHNSKARLPNFAAGRRCGASRINSAGFTLIELVVVLIIIGVLITLLTLRTGTYDVWREEAFIRRLSETITFLNHQAVVDQSFYALKIDFENNQYSVGVMRADTEPDPELQKSRQYLGDLTVELAGFLSPALTKDQEFTEPPNFPSLAEPVDFPPGATFTNVRTMRGVKYPGDVDAAYIYFSPRGFSEFAVLHLRLSRGNVVTILINPFTGLTDIYREYRDFEWTYGRQNDRK